AVSAESKIPATALQSPPCRRHLLSTWADPRISGRNHVSRWQRYESHPEHLCFKSGHEIASGRAVPTVRFFRTGDFTPHGRYEPRLLAGEPHRAGLEGATHDGLCC